MSRDYYKQNRLKQLRAFCHTAQTGSMSRAAEKMDLTQPSISLLIRALEKDMAHQLFGRRGPRIYLTAEGRSLLDIALPLVEGLENLPAAFDEQVNKHIGGELHIAASEAILLQLLSRTLRQFHSAYPQIRVCLHNVTSPDGLTQLQAGEIDLAVVALITVPQDVLFTPLADYDPVLIMPNDHPLAGRSLIRLEEISQYGLILPPRELTTAQMVEMVFSQHNINYRVVMEARGWQVIKKYVERDIGIAVVPRICLSQHDDLATIPLQQYFPKCSYGLVLRREQLLSPAARRFVEMLAPQALKNWQPGTGKRQSLRTTSG